MCLPVPVVGGGRPCCGGAFTTGPATTGPATGGFFVGATTGPATGAFVAEVAALLALEAGTADEAGALGPCEAGAATGAEDDECDDDPELDELEPDEDECDDDPELDELEPDEPEPDDEPDECDPDECDPPQPPKPPAPCLQAAAAAQRTSAIQSRFDPCLDMPHLPAPVDLRSGSPVTV